MPTDLYLKQGISNATCYTWRKEYEDIDVSDAKRLKALKEDNAKLKKILSEQTIYASTL